jgi:hypothetical protein
MPPRVKLQGRDSWTGMNDSTRSVELRELCLESPAWLDSRIDKWIAQFVPFGHHAECCR